MIEPVVAQLLRRRPRSAARAGSSPAPGAVRSNWSSCRASNVSNGTFDAVGRCSWRYPDDGRTSSTGAPDTMARACNTSTRIVMASTFPPLETSHVVWPRSGAAHRWRRGQASLDVQRAHTGDDETGHVDDELHGCAADSSHAP